MPSRSLPPVPNWEHIRKQAKDLLAQVCANDAAALSRATVYSAAFSSLLAVPNSAALRLSDAQLIIAREYGFASWPRLKQHVAQALAAHQAVLTDDARTAQEAASNPEAYPNDAQTIHSASWIETRTRWDEDMEEEAHVSYWWIRLSPPALAWRNIYGDSWSLDVMDANGHLHTASSWDHSVLSPKRHIDDAAELLRKVFFPHPQSGNFDIDQEATEELKDWRQDSVEEQGNPFARWRREVVSGNFQVAQTIWTEPKTCRIARQERRETNLLTGKLSTVDVRDRYAFNQPAPAGTFEMPPDKPIRLRDDKDISPEVWDALSSQERQAVQDIIARSDTGWRKADVRAFGSAWKFEFQEHLPCETEWKRRVEQQAELWSDWNSQIKSANTQEYVPVRYNTHSGTWVAEKRKVLRVEVNVHVTWQEGAGNWQGAAEFFLRKHAGRYKIVHWECPWAEIEAARKQAMELS